MPRMLLYIDIFHCRALSRTQFSSCFLSPQFPSRRNHTSGFELMFWWQMTITFHWTAVDDVFLATLWSQGAFWDYCLSYNSSICFKAWVYCGGRPLLNFTLLFNDIFRIHSYPPVILLYTAHLAKVTVASTNVASTFSSTVVIWCEKTETRQIQYGPWSPLLTNPALRPRTLTAIIGRKTVLNSTLDQNTIYDVTQLCSLSAISWAHVIQDACHYVWICTMFLWFVPRFAYSVGLDLESCVRHGSLAIQQVFAFLRKHTIFEF